MTLVSFPISFSSLLVVPMRRRMGGAASEEAWSSDTAVFEARDRQIELWRMVIRARYAAVGAAALLATTPAAGPKHWWLAAIAIFLVIPYNAVYDVLLRRRGVLPNTVAYTDQVVAVGIIAFAPELTVPLLVVMLAVAATSAVAFGRRVAAQAALVGAIGTGVVMTIAQPEDAVPVYLIYLVAGAFITSSSAACRRSSDGCATGTRSSWGASTRWSGRRWSGSRSAETLPGCT